MLNIEALYEMIQGDAFLPEEKWKVYLVTALVEQRIILGRIAELLDVHHMGLSEIESDLNRIVEVFKDHNIMVAAKFDAAMKVIIDEPPEDELPADEPESVVHLEDQNQKNGTACGWIEEGDSKSDDASKITCANCKSLVAK